MVNKNIWLSMRHFLTEEYCLDIYMGQQQYPICDTNLVTNGYLEQLSSCTIFASPLMRSAQTVEYIVSSYLNVKFRIAYLDELKERGLGDFEGRPKELIRHDPEYFVDKKFIVTKTPPNGESLMGFRERVENAVRIMTEEYNKNNILVVSHLQTLRMIKFSIENRYDYQNWHSINYNHGEVVKENYENE